MSAVHYRPALLKLVMDGKVKTNLQIAEAVAFLKKLPANAVVLPLLVSLTSSWMSLLWKRPVELELR